MNRDDFVGLNAVRLEEAKALLDRLDATGFPLGSAYWIFDSDSRDWRLTLVTSLVDEEGSLEAYGRIQQLLEKDFPIRLDEITVAGTNSPAARLFWRALSNAEDLSGMRITGGVYDGRYVEDAYIYRLE